MPRNFITKYSITQERRRFKRNFFSYGVFLSKQVILFKTFLLTADKKRRAEALRSDCRQSQYLSLRGAKRRGNPYSPKIACLLTFLPENGFPRQCAHWLGMTCFELCLHIERPPGIGRPFSLLVLFSLDASPIADPARDQRHPFQDQGGGVQPIPAQLGAGQAADSVLAVEDELVQT